MAIKIKPEFVSAEDFQAYTGINLDSELNDSTSPLLFLRDAENEVINYANKQSWRPIYWAIKKGLFSADQMDAFRMAILEQAKYMFENGDALANSGLDPEQGTKFGYYERATASISPKVYDILFNEGIITRVMRSRY